ncbi:MAG: hypothetical protein LBH13_06495 [Cellulomonadaceae bacterium]|jgi:hypothetical protein|nr:hypothetical protein [Cellulomonadaceae bacterium]
MRESIIALIVAAVAIVLYRTSDAPTWLTTTLMVTAVFACITSGARNILEIIAITRDWRREP